MTTRRDISRWAKRSRPCLEALEERALLSDCTVTLLTDTLPLGAPGELRHCIRQAVSGDTILFKATGTIGLRNVLPTLDANLTLLGPGADALTIQRTSQTPFRIFTVAAARTVDISGLTIANGWAESGGGIHNSGTLTVSYCSFRDNLATPTASRNGGGAVYSSGRLTITGSVFTGNAAHGGFTRGGAVWNAGGTLTVTDSYFQGNQAASMGGVENHAHGGAILTEGNSAIDNSTFTGNAAVASGGFRNGAGGGAISHQQTGTLTVTYCVFFDNSTTSDGGALANGGRSFAPPATVEIRNSAFYNNSAISGGALGNFGVTNVREATYFGNRAFAGGAMWNLGTLTVRGSSVAYNETQDHGGILGGGAIANDSIPFGATGNVTVMNSAIFYNTARTGGGGISNLGNLVVRNSTISSNSAGADGGGIEHLQNNLAIHNSTIAANEARREGGGIYLPPFVNDIPVSNTIFAHNNAPIGFDIRGRVLSQGRNVILDPRGASGFHPEDLLEVDPLLGPLDGNGGPTPTHALLEGSPALDVGNNAGAPEFDQRGLPRIVAGTIDIGAFEVQLGPVTSFRVSAPAVVAAGSPFDVTLRALDSYGHTVTGYTGTVAFVSTDEDPSVRLPANYTFTTDDRGVHTFTGDTVLVTPGEQYVVAYDLATEAYGFALVTVVPGGAPGAPGRKPPSPHDWLFARDLISALSGRSLINCFWRMLSDGIEQFADTARL